MPVILNCIYLFLALNLVNLQLSFRLLLISLILGSVLTALLLILLKQNIFLVVQFNSVPGSYTLQFTFKFLLSLLLIQRVVLVYLLTQIWTLKSIFLLFADVLS